MRKSPIQSTQRGSGRGAETGNRKLPSHQLVANFDFAGQSTVYRTLLRDLKQTRALGVSQGALQMNPAADLGDMAVFRLAVGAVPGMDAAFRQIDHTLLPW